MKKPRSRIVADPAPCQTERNAPDMIQSNSGDAEINGPPVDVKAVLGHTTSLPAQQFIVERRPISGYDLDFVPPAKSLVHRIHKLNHPNVNGLDLVGVVAPQKPIQLVERIRIIEALRGAVDDGGPLSRVKMEKREPSFREAGSLRLCRKYHPPYQRQQPGQ